MSLTKNELSFLRSARIAHLATADAGGRPHVIPICFAFDGQCLFSPIDEKPKRAEPTNLKRLRNIKENPQVSLIIDRYDENWTKLAYLLVFGKARLLSSGKKHQGAVRLLRRKYPQYRNMAIERRPMIAISLKKVVVWGSV